MSSKHLDVVIVGGSLTGLMHGVVLKRLGHNVHILERNLSLDGQAAGIVAKENVQELLKHHDASGRPWSIVAPGLQFLDAKQNVKTFWKMVLPMTSWNVLYYRLRANFNGVKGIGCPELSESVGKVVYEQGKTVTDITYTDGHITVDFDNVVDGGGGSLHAGLVLAADGSTSRIRQQMLQTGLQRQYAGYVAWRGIVPEREISEETRKVFSDRASLHVMKRSYIAMYTIPGENGSLAPGECLMNFIWYCNHAEDSQEFTDIMTDKDGYRHRTTLPIGKMRDEVWAKQKAFATRVLPAPFAELVNKTSQAFVSTVADIPLPSRATFFDGKLLLVGDALQAFRPHVASSTNQAALHALLLEKVLRNELTLEEWERQVLQYAHVTRLRSIVWGSCYQFGLWTFVISALHFAQALVLQWVGKLWYG